MSYLASFGMPNELWMSILPWRSATAIADRIEPVAYGPMMRSVPETSRS